jgi:hypothetical protein
VEKEIDASVDATDARNNAIWQQLVIGGSTPLTLNGPSIRPLFPSPDNQIEGRDD